MKKIFAILISALLLGGCTLEEKVVSSSMPENFYQTTQQCIVGLNGCYQPLRNIYGNQNYFDAIEGVSDIIYSAATDRVNAICRYSPTSPEFGATIWTQGYRGVMRCNAMYAAIERAPLTESEKAPLLAECAILRALYYYVLTCNFGDVPYYTEEVTNDNNYAIVHLPRMSAVDTRDKLIDELIEWLMPTNHPTRPGKEALLLQRTYDNENYRIGAAVGLMVAGKMCMWNKRWVDAIDIYGVLEDIYGNGAGNPAGALSQYPLSDIPFGKKYTRESIFEISNTSREYGLQVTGTLASICTPSRSSDSTEGDETDVDQIVSSDYYGGIGIPEMGDQQRTQAPLRPTAYYYKTIMPYVSGSNPTPDMRCAAFPYGSDVTDQVENTAGNLAWRWKGYAKGNDRTLVDPIVRWFSGLSKATDRPYLGNKFWCFGMIYNQDSNNFKVFRFAGVLLNLAEAHLMLNGDMTKACAYLNAVRSRAGLTALQTSAFEDNNDLLSEIQDESARELFGEYCRRHDLVRWGIWYERVMAYSDSSLLKGNIEGRPCFQYYPIPDTEVVLSDGALDNNEYNKYGL